MMIFILILLFLFIKFHYDFFNVDSIILYGLYEIIEKLITYKSIRFQLNQQIDKLIESPKIFRKK